ncbi:MAG: hypothetical protein RLZZ399_2858 [Verrucomicrobiota bacterium]|jgi:uncharacterized protein (DUF2132 family)
MSISHPNDPLHGVTLEKIVVTLVEIHGWEALGNRIPIRCFQFDPTVKSSLTFLRKTPWARKKVEEFYLRTKSLLQKNTPPRPLPPGATS